MPRTMSLKPRLALALAGASGLALGMLILYRTPPEQNPFAPPCVFHVLTGLHCPGCGATRATHALLHLRVGEAAQKNLLFVATLPFLAFWGGRAVWRWVRGRTPQEPPPLQRSFRPWMVWTFAGVIIAFGVLRNLPWKPFSLLAPQ
jgi:hypothetical protein